jgi:hypothetical protein
MFVIKLLAIIFFKRYIYMPFSEEERRNLENDGKFTPRQIQILERVQISYDNIKRLQDVEMRFITQEEGNNPTLRYINEKIMSVLQEEGDLILDMNGIVDETKLNGFIQSLEAFLPPVYYSSGEQSHSGGKKRRKSRRKSRKGRKSRRSRRKA